MGTYHYWEDFQMTVFKFFIKTKNEKDLAKCLSFFSYGKGEYSFVPGYNEIYGADTDIIIENGEYIADIQYSEYSFEDLPDGELSYEFFSNNLFDNVECQYQFCKEMIESTQACPFTFSFYMSQYNEYFHEGEFSFDGKTISYFDTAAVNGAKPVENRATAQYINGEFVNEEKEFNTKISG
jgi:hypothetical protein